MTGIIWQINIFYSLFLGSHLPTEFDPAVAEMTARLYYNYVELCTSAENSFSYRTQILYDLCENPQINITSDLPTSPGIGIEMNVYLNELNEVSKGNKFKVEYDENINISQCRSGNNYIWTSQALKHITYKGKIKSFDEVIELAVIGGGYRILKIHSNYVREMNIDCNNLDANEDVECNIVELAKEEYQAGRVELAVAHLEEAKMCGVSYDDSEVILIRNINIDSIYKSSLEKGKTLMQAGNYREALNYFYSTQRSYSAMNSEFKSKLLESIQICEAEINYASLVQQADFLFGQRNYKAALENYIKAGNLKSSKIIDAQIQLCNNELKYDYELKARQELSLVEKLIQNGNLKDQAEAFRIIMKYRYSGALTGKHYFYAAQISESPPASIKNEYDLNGKNRCLFTRQMLLHSHGLGYRSKGFETFWNEYLTEKSRTCE